MHSRSEIEKRVFELKQKVFKEKKKALIFFQKKVVRLEILTIFATPKTQSRENKIEINRTNREEESKMIKFFERKVRNSKPPKLIENTLGSRITTNIIIILWRV